MWSSPQRTRQTARHDRPVLRGWWGHGGVVGVYTTVLYNNNTMVANHHPEKKSTPPKFFARPENAPLQPFFLDQKNTHTIFSPC